MSSISVCDKDHHIFCDLCVCQKFTPVTYLLVYDIYFIINNKLLLQEIDLGLAADLGTLQKFPKIIGNDR